MRTIWSFNNIYVRSVMSNLTDSSYVRELDEQEIETFERVSPTNYLCSFTSLKSDTPQSDLYDQFAMAVLPYNDTSIQESPSQRRFSAAVEKEAKFQMIPCHEERNSLTYVNPNFTLFFPDEKDVKKLQRDDEEPLTEELIANINARIGHDGDQELVYRHIKKMRRLGGLEPLKDHEKIDIPSARMGLAFLFQINDSKNKLFALESLLAILKQDKYHKPTATNLVSLAIKLLALMDRFLMQAETLQVQVKIAEVYDALTEALHNHYGKRHINLITVELSRELVKAPKGLGRLNGLADTKIKYYTDCALEGVRRLENDRQELFIFAERIYHAILGAASIYLETGDPFEHFRLIFKDLDPRIKGTWYNAILVIKNLSKDAYTDIKKLTALQLLLGSKSEELNWKFTYAGVNALFDIALNGATEDIRFRAFQGIKQVGAAIPGISYFINSKELPKYRDGNAVKHLKAPKLKDPNFRIRELCAERLFELESEAPDELIRTKASQAIRRRLKEEDNPIVLSVLKRGFKKDYSYTELG